MRRCIVLLCLLGAGALAAVLVFWPAHQPRDEPRASGSLPCAEDLLVDSDDYTGPALTEEMIQAAEAKFGYKLPESYLRLVRVRNGGWLKRECFPTSASAFEGYVEVAGIRGIGGEFGIDSEDLGSREAYREWGYPEVGIVVGDMPSAGHEVIMLDYSVCGPEGEPRVIYVDTETGGDASVVVLAPDFETFLCGLVDCEEFGR
jgi:hypothetical protein